MNSTPDSPSTSEPQGLHETTTDFYVIDNLMRRIKRAQPLVSISIPDSEDAFVSSLLDLDPVKRTLQFDELNPKTGQALLLQQGEMRAHIRIEGQDVRFKVGLLEVGERDGIAFNTCSYPASVRNPQRRAYYRARISYSNPVTLQLYAKESDTLLATGLLSNLSLGGLGAVMNEALPGHFSGTLLEAALTFPELGTITTPIHVCFIGQKKSGSILGARFIYANDRIENQIGNIVFRLQRDELRRIRRTEIETERE